MLKTNKVGKWFLNVGQPSTNWFEQTTSCRLSTVGSTFNASRLMRFNHLLRIHSTIGNWKKRTSLSFLLSEVQPTAIQCLISISLSYSPRCNVNRYIVYGLLRNVPEISREVCNFLLSHGRVLKEQNIFPGVEFESILHPHKGFKVWCRFIIHI